MGLTFTTVCARCGTEAPDVGDFGYIGTPSLATTRTKGDTQSFGYLYAGLAALGLLTEEIEAFKAFLDAHRGHSLTQFSDADVETFGDDETEAPPQAPSRTRKFVFRKGRFVEAFHELVCATCDKVQRSGGSTRLRPFTARALELEEVQVFLTHCEDLDSSTHHVGGFPFDDVEAIGGFLRSHAKHGISVRLSEGQAAAQPKALLKQSPAPSSWTLPEWAARDDENSLGRIANAETLAELVRLRHRDPAVRIAALGVLRARADSGVFGHVASMWLDPVPAVRAAALATIGALDDARKERVLGHALWDESPEVRTAAAAAISSSELDRAHAADLAATPRAPDPRPRPKKVARALAALRSALCDSSVSLRTRAVEQLATCTELGAVDALLDATADPNTSTRSQAFAALAHQGGDDARVAPALLGALDDYGDWVRSAAVKSLGTRKLAAAVPRIRERLLASEKDYDANLDALRQIGGPAATAALAAGLAHPSVQVRGGAVSRLGQLGTPDVVEHLVAALADPHDDVRSRAAHELGELRSQAAVAALAAGYRQLSQWPRLAVVAALAKIGGRDALELLTAALEDDWPEIRREAAAGLVQQNDADGNRALVAAARKRDPVVANAAWRLLLAEGDPATENALAGALFGDEAVAIAATYLQCGNATLAERARSWLDGRRPPRSPRIVWGSQRSSK